MWNVVTLHCIREDPVQHYPLRGMMKTRQMEGREEQEKGSTGEREEKKKKEKTGKREVINLSDYYIGQMLASWVKGVLDDGEDGLLFNISCSGSLHT